MKELTLVVRFEGRTPTVNSDSAQSMERCGVPTQGAIRDSWVHFGNSQIAWSKEVSAQGATAGVLLTADSGAQWSDIQFHGSITPTTVDFVNGDDGWVYVWLGILYWASLMGA